MKNDQKTIGNRSEAIKNRSILIKKARFFEPFWNKNETAGEHRGRVWARRECVAIARFLTGAVLKTSPLPASSGTFQRAPHAFIDHASSHEQDSSRITRPELEIVGFSISLATGKSLLIFWRAK